MAGLKCGVPHYLRQGYIIAERDRDRRCNSAVGLGSLMFPCVVSTPGHVVHSDGTGRLWKARVVRGYGGKIDTKNAIGSKRVGVCVTSLKLSGRVWEVLYCAVRGPHNVHRDANDHHVWVIYKDVAGKRS